MDIYDEALKKLRSDETPLHQLERAIGLPEETLRDIKRSITVSPRLKTLRKIVAHYERNGNGRKRAS